MLHPALVGDAHVEVVEGLRPYRVLFLCTHNSARSQLAEGILRAHGGNLVQVFSAGSEPGQVHPLAIQAADALQIDIRDQRSQHMNEFVGETFDYVITVCDRVREVCPVFPDDHKQIHWSFPDPAEVTGSDEDQYQAFVQTARELSTRIHYLLLMMERRHQRP
jgi:protein-tyrosine-phosphatase